MKKRDFLKGTVAGATLVGTTSASATSSMLFGTPGSLDPKLDRNSALRLSLSKSNLPEKTWGEVENFISAATRIFEDDQAKANFVSAPQVYFSRAGVSFELSRISREIDFLRIGLDDDVQAQVASGNYRALFDAMKRANLHQGDPSALASRITKTIKADIETYRQIIVDRKGAKSAEATNAGIALEALARAGRGGGPGLQPSISVDVEIVVVSFVASAVMVAVAAYVLIIVVVALTGTTHPGSGHIGGGLGRMDPKLYDDYMASAQMAKFIGAPKLESEAMRNLVHQELDAVLEAMVAAGLYERSALENQQVREDIFKHVDEMLMV
jgi:hypothetical protein